MEKRILNDIYEQLTVASKQGVDAVWTVYNTLIAEKGTDWQTLAAITIASSELLVKNANGKNDRLANAFEAMNDMVFDYVAQHAEEINDYRQFKNHADHWQDQIPATL